MCFKKMEDWKFQRVVSSLLNVKNVAVLCVLVDFVMTVRNWELLNHTFDLHNSEYVEGNIMTEYETRFVEKGNAICCMELK